MRTRHENGSGDYDSDLLGSIIETAPDAILTIDVKGTVLSFSPAAEKIFGYAPDEVIGNNVKMLMPEPYHSEHDDYVASYVATGEKKIIGIGREVRAKRKNGEIFVAELAVGEVQTETARIFTGFLRDATDRVNAQRNAARLRSSLDQMARMQTLGELSSALAHEVNQPLTAISNFARAAKRALANPEADPEKLRGYLDHVAEQAQRAGQIIRRMRRLVERGKPDLQQDDVNEIVHEAIRSIAGTERTDPEIFLELAEDLPDVLVDRIQIQQVLVNLVRNAREATARAHGHDVHVTTELTGNMGPVRLRAAQAHPHEVMLTVSDQGPGIPEDMLDSLFDPFVSTKSDGLGIGLSICRSIVHAHGGRIWAENKSNGGAEIHFTLPIVGPEG